jgi:receptor tyrosine kinase-like orphan receptor 1
MTLPNVDKNIYGNSAHSPQIEMTSLLNQNSGNAPQVPPHRGSVLKIPQYILGDVKFVEELGK